MGPSRLLVALAAGLSCAVVPLAPVQADIDQQVQQAQAELTQLQQQAAAAAEQVNEATLQWQEAQQSVADKQAQIAATQQTLASTQQDLNQVISQIYRSGGVDPTLLALASDQPSNWLATLDAARIIASSQNDVLETTEITSQQLAREEQALEKAERRAERARDDIIDAKAAIDARVADSTAVLSGLQAEQQRQLAEQLAQQQQQQQNQADNAADQVAQLPKSTTKPVVEFAIKQVGKQFEQGAAGPDAFDASGLVKAAWEQAGVELPHSVKRQYADTRRIDITQLQAGDIVFLYATDQHAGIYTGDGYFVHAKSPREGVVYEKLFTNEYMSQFAGAGRPKA